MYRCGRRRHRQVLKQEGSLHILGHSGNTTPILARSPPSTLNSAPVQNPALGPHRKAIMAPTSSALPTRPIGCAKPHFLITSSSVPAPLFSAAAKRNIGVSIDP